LNERDKTMIKLSRSNIYALRASLLLAKSPPGVPVPCSQLAREGKMPERFLLQILRRLVNHGLLDSACGVAGGYSLARSPRLITLRDILDAGDKAVSRRRNELDFVSSAASRRVTETILAGERAARSEFEKLTLATLLSEDAT
jgi:Rrf2 family protein